MKARELIAVLAALLVVTACAGPAEILGPPTPAQILGKPAAAGIKDMHAKLTAHGANGSPLTGEGVVLLEKKAYRFTFQTSLGTLSFSLENISIDGKDYTRVGTDKWTESPSSAGSKTGDWASGKNPKLVAEETIAGDKAWHVKATDASNEDFELWVRQKDGYPLKYVGGGSTGLTMEFSNFNSGASVTAPAADQIKPQAKTAKGGLGAPLQLNLVRVTAVSKQANFVSDNQFETPKAGNQYLALEVLYEATGKEKVSYSPSDWKIKDSTGGEYSTTFASGKTPELQSGDLAPGDKVRGWIIFEIPAGAAGLTAVAKIGDDTATFTL